jgi:four helix bundle protein
LNVAEGNGRYSELDHLRFVEVAATSAVKAGVYLDLCAQKALIDRLDITPGRDLLGRIAAMLAGF